MKVEDLMTRDVKTCAPQDTLETAARTMRENGIGGLPVVEADNKTVGFLTDRDICMAACDRGEPLRALTVGDAMAHKVIACKLADDLGIATGLMMESYVRRLMVVDAGGRLSGLLSLDDIAREAQTAHSWVTRQERSNEVARIVGAICLARGHAREAIRARAKKPGD
jgi:CBS domain-containing protein